VIWALDVRQAWKGWKSSNFALVLEPLKCKVCFMRAINLAALLLIEIAIAAHAQQSAPSKSSIASKTVLVHVVVLDQSGAVIPSAEVVFKGESGIVTAHPNATANVNVNLPTGKYVVLVSAKGFLTSKVEDYSVLTQSAAEFRVVLKVDPNNLRGDEFVEQPQVPIQSAVVPQFIAETAQAEQKKSGGSTAAQKSQPGPKIDPKEVPDISIQTQDYATARKDFATKLLIKGPAPFQDHCTDSAPPDGVSEVRYKSGSLELKAWINAPAKPTGQKLQAVLFLHGGFCLDSDHWNVAKPFRDAGFVVMMPSMRGENGQPGYYSQNYDEVDDVLGAAKYLHALPYVDPTHLYIAGHSIGASLTLLSAEVSTLFRAAASYSGSPDAVGYTRFAVYMGNPVPFNFRDVRELQLRSARVYAGSFKCPVRMYYGSDEEHFAISNKATAEIAQGHHLDVQAIEVDGGHTSALPAAIQQSIEFFGQVR
jgi:dienelactone hydrolase